MTPDKLRLKLRTQLENWFRIDEWSLSNPESRVDNDRPASIAREKPLTLVQAVKNPTGYSRNVAYQIHQEVSYSIVYRLSNKYTYNEVVQIYRSPFETQAIAFLGYLTTKSECIGCTQFKNPKVHVYCPETRQGDYLLVGRIEGTAVYESDPVVLSKSKLFS